MFVFESFGRREYRLIVVVTISVSRPPLMFSGRSFRLVFTSTSSNAAIFERLDVLWGFVLFFKRVCSFSLSWFLIVMGRLLLTWASWWATLCSSIPRWMHHLSIHHWCVRNSGFVCKLYVFFRSVFNFLTGSSSFKQD